MTSKIVSYRNLRLAVVSKVLLFGLLVCCSVAGFSQEQPKLATIIATIQFTPENSQVTNEHMVVLQEVAKKMRANSNMQVYIKGYMSDTSRAILQKVKEREYSVYRGMQAYKIASWRTLIPNDYAGGDPTRIDIFIQGTGAMPKPIIRSNGTIIQ